MVHISQAPPPSSPGNISAVSSAHSLDRTITPVHSAESTPAVWYWSSYDDWLVCISDDPGITWWFSSVHCAKYMHSPGLLHCILWFLYYWHAHTKKSVLVQKSCTRTNRCRYSSSGEHTAESYVKLQFVDLAGSECIGKPEAQDYYYYCCYCCYSLSM